MYSISHDGRILFDPRVEGYPVQNPKLSREANKIGTLSFTIFPPHPEYQQIKPLASILTVYKDGQTYFKARPAYRKKLFRGAVEYKCEEVIAWLDDFKIRPMQYTGTAEGFMAAVLSSYNALCGSGQAIQKGRVTVTGNVEIEIKDYPGHLSALQKNLVDVFGGYLVPRYKDDGLYIDYLTEDDLPMSTQPIQFGENLTDLFIETSSDDTFSVLIPIGGNPEREEGEEEEPENITIASVNGGKIYIENAAGIALYGRRETKQEWNDITDPAELLAAAREYLDTIAVKFKDSVHLKAVDLHNVDAEISSFRYMTRVHAESTKHGMSSDYIYTREDVPLGTPTNTDITLGAVKRTLTDSVAATAENYAMSVNAAENASKSAKMSYQTATAAAMMLSMVVGEQQSNALFYVYESDGQEIIKVNPNYRFYVGNYDVENELSQ